MNSPCVLHHRSNPSLFLVLTAFLALALLAGCMAPEAGSTDTPGLAVEHARSSIVRTEEVIIGLLVVSAIVSVVTQRLGIPYTVGLVLVGFFLTFIGSVPVINVTPDLILALLVPPLVFEAAFHLNFADLRRELPLVLMLAIPGVILTTLLVGGIVSVSAGISLPYALVFGALIAATDPVAVVALFRSLGVPKRLQVLLEGESLLNDGTAIVLFNLMLGIALTGKFHLGSSILEFLLVSGGGILVGAALGILVSQVIGRIDNYLVETTLTTVLAYGSYLVAEYFLGVSGVLAVVAAGLASGQIGPKGMSPTTRIVVFNFWEYAAFLANSFIFLIIGLEIDLNLMIAEAPAIFWGILAVLVARAVTVYGLSLIRRDIPVRWKNVLFWGGLRGAISLALALGLPAGIPNREQLQAMAFGVVLFTLLVEGLTMRRLIRHSGIAQLSTAQLEYERRHARAFAARAAQARLLRLNRDGLISDYTLGILRPILKGRIQKLTDEVRQSLEAEPGLHQEELLDAWREILRTERSSITDLHRSNIISEEIYEELVAEVDFRLDDPESYKGGKQEEEEEQVPPDVTAVY